MNAFSLGKVVRNDLQIQLNTAKIILEELKKIEGHEAERAIIALACKNLMDNAQYVGTVVADFADA